MVRRPGQEHEHAEGHDHGKHDHGKQDHDHGAHDHEKAAAPGHETRAAETGGTACQLDLEIVLPGTIDEVGRFAKLEALLEARTGISNVHIRKDGGKTELCVHYDHDRVTLDQVLKLVKLGGTEVAARYRHKSWFVRGMDCAQCGFIIEHALGREQGILSASVGYAAERVFVEFDSRTTSPRAIEKRVRALGFTLEEPEQGKACSGHAHGGGLSPRLELPLAIVSAALVAAGYTLGKIAVEPAWLTDAAYLVAAAAGGVFSSRTAVRSIRQLRFDIETLMVISAIAAIALGAFFEGALLLALFSLGHALEHRAMERTRRAIEALAKLRPEVARIKREGALVEVPVGEVKKGDRIFVRPGDRLPLDGIIRDGQSALDQAALTGESVPVAKGPGDEVFAGTINAEAALEIEVTKLATESALARVVDMVAEAESQKSPTQRFTQRVERTFVPIVLVAAPLLAGFQLFRGASVTEALLQATALLVSASPCALAIATPAAVLSAVARSGRGGVLMKGGAHLENLGKVAAIAFDKTGTLTIGEPKLVDTAPATGVDKRLLLATAAGAEGLSAHPIARAILEGVKDKGIEPEPATGLEAVHGKGIRAVIAGEPVVVGNLAMFDGAVPPEIAASVARLEEAGQTTMIVRRGERFLGVIGVADTLRPEAKETLATLKTLGVRRMIMLTGDNQRVAKAVAAEVGLTEARGPLMPEGKVAAIKELAREGGVAMVGDGVNDAPALAAASVGISMGGAGNDVALETADVVLMSNDLRRLPFAVGLARKATSVVRQNVVMSLGVSAVLVVASIFGFVEISQAVIFHEGSTLFVLGNAFRLLGYRG